MIRRGFRWHSASKRIRVVQQNIERKYLKPVFGSKKVRVRPAIPELRLSEKTK